MKIIFLAPGLARIKRGYERFVLELAAELRKQGFDAVCWGTTEAPGVDLLPVPARLDLQKLALDQLHADPRFASFPAAALQDWSIYAEDQVFAIPAAHKIRELLDTGERFLVYARWQGGLVDPSGAPTELLKTLASAARQGTARLIVHTDYIYAPIDSLLWTAGSCFHSLGSWISEPLRQLGVLSNGIIELPMCVDSSVYRNAFAHRESVRRGLGIPAGAFVILSVGSFDTTTPDKRHNHLLHEILRLPDADAIWWIVAGSRGGHPTPWELEARAHLGSRFIPLTNLPFQDMPRLYGAADLFALASTGETFGLVCIEAQIAGLPTLIHDAKISRELCSPLAEDLLAISLVDMNRSGAASAAIARWQKLLAEPHRHASLQAFARAQEQRYGWEFTAPRFANAFRDLLPSTSESSSERRGFGTWDEQFHRQAVRCFEQQQFAEAASLLSRALGTRETAERWNDWGAVQLALSHRDEAEQGFRRALVLEPDHAQAAANLGVLLASSDRADEAAPFLAQSVPAVDETQRAALTQMLDACRTNSAARLPDDETLSGYFRERKSAPQSFVENIPYCIALLKTIPSAAPGERLLCLGAWARFLADAFARFKAYANVSCCDPSDPIDPPQHSPAFRPHETPWPLGDSSFDSVVLSRVLGALPDPMLALSEINRVLRPGGALFLTVSNLASAKSLQSLLRGESPYVAGRFSSAAPASKAPPREYTVSEVEALAAAAGFAHFNIRTQDLLWESPAGLMSTLASSGFAIGSRGDTIFLCARKQSAVLDRYPTKLYDLRAASSPVAPVVSPEAARQNTPTGRPAVPALMRILVVYETLPLLDRGGADHRLMQVIRLLREQGHAVTFLAPRGFGKETYAPVLQQPGVDLRIEDAQVLLREGTEIIPQWTLQEVLREGQFDLAILTLWFWMGVSLPEYYLDDIRRLSPSTRIAVLTDDCHGLRETGCAELSHLWSDAERASDFHEREMEIYRRADLVISISPVDRQRIRGEVSEVPVELLPMMVEPGDAGPGFAARDGIVYLANFNNPASLDGLEWYLREVAPLLRSRLPSLKLYLVGSGLPDAWTTSDPNVVRVGPAPDLSAEFGRRRILISPVRFGTGIKTKNLHALAHGLPIVTNTMGAEGLNFTDRQTALLADDPREFANAVVTLYTNEDLWRRLAANSRSHIAAHFSKSKMDCDLAAILSHARAIAPRPNDSSHVWSVRLVEKLFLEVLTFRPAKERPSIRILAYARAAEQLLAHGRTEEARRQLRHVFSFVPQRMSRNIFSSTFLTAAEAMDRVYRQLGDATGAAEFRREANQFAVGAFLEPAPVPNPPRVETGPDRAAPDRNRKSAAPVDFSVIVSTYNRSAVLSECLQALDRQSLSSRRFEVIVIDDGSTDGTQALCEARRSRHAFHYLRQENSGAGAARRRGGAQARGKYLLLINDDTIGHPDLLRRHLEAQRTHASEKVAVLGDFKYPEAARNRALTHFLNSQPFLFPQVALQPGFHDKNAFFVTCNLSIRRDAVLSVGSFDPRYRIAEDTELGIRLMRKGFRVCYVPQAQAVHQHLDFTIRDLVRRAENYGNMTVGLYEKHPALIEDGKGPFGTLDPVSLEKIRSFVADKAAEVAAAVESLAKFDSLDFVPLFSKESFSKQSVSKQMIGKSAADEIMDLFSRSIPIVFWFHLFRGFLQQWNAKRSLPAAQEVDSPSIRNEAAI